MRIRVKTKGVNLWLPVPIFLVGVAIRMIPEAAFDDMKKEVPEPYAELMSRQTFLLLADSCKEALKECKGLEIVHVEAHDGTYVSIRV